MPFDLRLLQALIFGSIQAGLVFSLVPDMSTARGAAASIIKLFDNVSEIETNFSEGGILERKDTGGQIQFDNVHFCYPTRPAVRVLRGLNLTVEPGTYVALVGASGCGKSTM